MEEKVPLCSSKHTSNIISWRQHITLGHIDTNLSHELQMVITFMNTRFRDTFRNLWVNGRESSALLVQANIRYNWNCGRLYQNCRYDQPALILAPIILNSHSKIIKETDINVNNSGQNDLMCNIQIFFNVCFH